MKGRALLFHGADKPLELVYADVPEPEGAEVRVRTLACTLCRSDLHTHAGRRPAPTPMVLGHEIIGRIDAFGPDAPQLDGRGQPLTVGARVTWSVAAGCGRCFFCTEGLPQKCERLYKYGHERVKPQQPFAGGLADFVLLRPGTACLRLPDALADELAVPANCATATVAAALRLAGVNPAGKTVLIFGAGVLGLTAAAWTRTMQAAAVLVCDPDPARRSRAAVFGATHLLAPDALDAVHACTDGRGADLVLELAGVRDSVEAAIQAARIGGTVILAGTVLPTPPVALDPERVVRRLLTIRGVHNYAPVDLAAAVDFLAGPASAFPFASLLGPVFELADAPAALAQAHASPGVRVIVKPRRSES